MMFDDLDAETLATDIRMSQKSGGPILVVEGESDAKLFERFIREDCDIIVSDGKQYLLDALGILSGEMNGLDRVMGVVDADFWHLDGVSPPVANVVVTDFHDIEMTLITSKSLKRVERELVTKAKLKSLLKRSGAKSLSELLLNAAKPLGELRWLSFRKGWRLAFSELDLKGIVDARSMTVNVLRAINRLISGTSQPPPRATIIAQLETGELTEFDPRQLCRGHDACAILAAGLRSAIGGHPKSVACQEHVEEMLRLAFDETELRKTDMYASIREWECESGVSILSSSDKK